MSLRDRAAVEVKWSFVASWGRQGLSVVVYAVLARLLAPAEFGLVALTGVYVALMEIFVNQGLGMALIQRRDLKPEHINAAFWLAVACGTVIALGTAIGAPWIASALGDEALVPIVRAISPAFVLSALANVQLALVRKEMKFRFLAKQAFISTLAGGTCGIVLACLGAGVWSLVAQSLVGTLVTVALCWFTSDWHPSLRIDFAPLRELFGVSSKVMFNNCLAFVQRQFDRLVVGKTLGAATLGIYSVGSRIGMLLGEAVQSPIGDVALPAFAQISDDERVGPAVSHAIELSCAITFPLAVFLCLFADVVIPLVFGPQWGAAVPVLRFGALGFGIQAAFQFTWVGLMARGRPGLCIVLTAADAIASTIAAFIGVQYGATGMTIAMVAKTVTTGIVGVFLLRYAFGLSIRQFVRSLLRPVPASLALVVLILVCRTIAGSDAAAGIVAAVAAGLLAPFVYGLVLRQTTRSTFDTLQSSLAAAFQRKTAQ